MGKTSLDESFQFFNGGLGSFLALSVSRKFMFGATVLDRQFSGSSQIVVGGSSSTRAIGNKFSFRDQFWKAQARPEICLLRKIVLHM